MSLSAYARRRGVSTEAISKAVSDGRLAESVVIVKGAPKIGDPDLADRELSANSRPRIDRAASPVARDLPDYYESRSVREAVRAEMETLKLAEKRGELVSALEIEARLVTVFTRCRTQLLAVPGRAKQRDPSLTTQQVALFEQLQREALEELASEPDAQNTG